MHFIQKYTDTHAQLLIARLLSHNKIYWKALTLCKIFVNTLFVGPLTHKELVTVRWTGLLAVCNNLQQDI